MPLIAATAISQLPGQLGQIFYAIVLPILLLAGVGVVLQRRLGLEMDTLRRLNFYFIMPAMVYFAVVTSELSGRDVLSVVGFGAACLCVQAGLTYAAGRVRGVPADLRRALLMSTMMHNAGNYGLPLQDLAFSRSGQGAAAMAYQSFVMITQNFFTFTIGILMAAGGRKDRHWRANLLHIAKFPPLYALAAALITVQIRAWLGESAPAVGQRLAPFWDVVVRAKSAFIALALLTLGAQLGLVARRDRRYPVSLSVVLRLIGGPLIGLGVIYALGLGGLVAQVLLISITTPTAVNCLLLCLEFDNHPDFAARAVFYSTLLSPVTVTLAIFVAQGNLLPGFAQ